VERLVQRLQLRRLSDDGRPRGHRGGGEQRRLAPLPLIGRGDLARDPGFATTAARRDAIAAIIQGWTGPRSRAEVVRTLAAAGVPAAPVNNVAEMVADQQVQARDMFVEVDHPHGRLKTTGTPLKLSQTPGRVHWLAPEPGEQNEEVFVGPLGYSREDLARWAAEGVI
jgi:crotonobetainyl-CoA:carnitine CoA-transferase CaiB-like acyl-CoA transferase